MKVAPMRNSFQLRSCYRPKFCYNNRKLLAIEGARILKGNIVKKNRIAALVSSILLPLTAMATDMPSLDRGRELFSGTTLGSNGKSCAGCHRDGKGLERISSYDEGELADIVNQCIRKPLAGKGLAPSSSDMRSLIIYIRSLNTSGSVKID